MTISSGTKSVSADFFIVDVNNPKPLLGLNTCQDLNIITINRISSDSNSNSILSSFPDVFTGLRKVDGLYNVKLQNHAEPVIHAPRKVPLSILPKLKATLDRLEKSGVITKSVTPTPWVNSMVIVEKKDNSLRICLDPKNLNKYIMRDYKTTPTAEEISSKLHNKSIFTVIDMADCYWHIQLDDASSELCTFNTPFGRYLFNRLPFGLACASDAAQAMVEKHFGDIDGVLAIHDDIIIASDTVSQHDDILKRVLQRAREQNIKFNKTKIQLRVPEVKYLGHLIGKTGLRPDPAKVSAISDMPPPESKPDLQRILGMVNYLGQFIPNLSQITTPLRSLLKKESHWTWEYEHAKAFNTIKHILTNQPILSFFDIQKDVTLQVDASSHGLGACLLQDTAPVSFASRSLTDSEKNYAQIEKELLAIVYGCEKFNQYIYGRNVVIESDHKPLENIMRKPLAETPPRMQRLLIRLQKYRTNVVYVPGKKLIIADTLSRSHLSTLPDCDDINEDIEVMIHTLVKKPTGVAG